MGAKLTKTQISLIKSLVNQAVSEDLNGSCDITTVATVPLTQEATGLFYVKSDGILAGLEIAKIVFEKVDPKLKFETVTADGYEVTKDTVFAKVSGSARSILTAERTALNFLQRMSGIATLTHKFVEGVKPHKAKILDTRKTVPGLRILDKMAVKIGGGENHRFGLYDMVLIKDNHIEAAGSVTKAIQAAKKYALGKHLIEVEVKDLSELKEALLQNPDRIMLDNMTVEEMAKAVKITNGQVPLEASGNVSLDTVKKIAQTGVDYISIGALTHSVKALDISLEIISKRKGA